MTRRLSSLASSDRREFRLEIAQHFALRFDELALSVELLAELEDFAGLDVDVGGLTLRTAEAKLAVPPGETV